MEPDQLPEPVPTTRPVSGRRYGGGGGSGTYLVGPASGAGMGVGPGGFGARMEGGGEGEEILDLDGVVIGSMGDDGDRDGGMVTEPNSPDKLGEGISLPLPER